MRHNNKTREREIEKYARERDEFTGDKNMINGNVM